MIQLIGSLAAAVQGLLGLPVVISRSHRSPSGRPEGAKGIVTNPYAGEEGEVEMGPGSYWYVPGGASHVTACVSEEPCLFYTYADGAWDIEVVEGT